MEIELKPYPEYNETDLPWLSSIPAHWDVRRNGQIFAQRNEIGFPSLPVLEVSLRTGVRVRNMDDLKRKQVMSDFSKYKRAMCGDIAYNMMRMWQGAVGIAPVDGLVSPAYVVARTRQNTDSRYYSLLFRTEAYMNEVNKYSHGIVADRNRLYWDEFKQMPSAYPPLNEQKQIADFLDANEKLVRKFIRNKRRLIDLLKEQKQIIINHAVTKGINPDVKLKPSGVDWLGEIPEHWSTAKIKKVALFGPSKSETNDNPDCEKSVVFLPMEKISVDGKIECSEKHLLKDIWNGFTYFRRGDVVIAKITPCFENGKGAYLSELESEYGFGTTELIVIRPLNRISGSFLRCHTSTNHFLLLGQQSMTGAAGQQRVSVDFIKNHVISLPPINEQDKIVEFIAHKTTEIDKAISRAEREIGLIREYRARLISDVVTGKVDVRNIAVADVNIIEDIGDIEEEPAEELEEALEETE